MENELVFTQKSSVWSDSLIFSKFFEISHNEVLKKIRNLTGRISPVKNNFIETNFINERGREYKKFLINRKGFMFLVMNIATPKADQIKLDFIDAFEAMEKALLNLQNVSWVEYREQGKIARKEETETIKQFVEYSISQGSKNANRYYGNITTMTYKALELIDQNKTTPIRGFLNINNIAKLAWGEQKAKEAMIKGMEQGLHYKEIYLLIKNEVEKLNEALPKSNFLSLT